jgi:hypothetical protein
MPVSTGELVENSSTGVALRSGFPDGAPRLKPCRLAALAPHYRAALVLRVSRLTGHELCATRQRLTPTAASRLFSKQGKLPTKHKTVVNFLLIALLFPAAALRAGQAAAPDRAVGDSLQNSPMAASDGGSAKKIDVCALLTSAEIEAAQGEPVKETKPSEEHGSSFLMSQCFFRTATFAKSVSFALAVPDPAKPSALTPREYWKKQFHPPEQEKTAASQAKSPKKTEEEHEEELSKPLPVAGLGEEAYWVGNPVIGAIYVLKGEVFLRISLGGVRDASERIEKSKALARAALGRF